MLRKLGFILILVVAVILIRCSGSPTGPEIRDLTGLEKNLVQADNKFGFKLFREINIVDQDKSIFISPLSVSMALGMTLNGANGQTQAAMEQTLELAGLTTEEINRSYQSLIELLTQLDPQVVFEIANSIWYRQGRTFEQEFIDLNKTYFDAEVRELNFDDPSAVDIINSWVSDKTHGKIDEIIKEIGNQIVMFLINAIYFNGTWTYEFDKELTRDDLFTLLDGSQTPCKMMIQTSKVGYFANDDFQAVDVPYGDQQFRMTVFLPTVASNLDNLIAQFNEQNWQSWLNAFEPDSVTLELPRFKLEYEIELNDVLAALGMGIAFTEGADFTRMYRPGGLFIDYVKHKTFVEVDEEGTEAAAVTVVAIGETSVGDPPDVRYMRVDHPFVFVIRENHSQSIIFVGKILEPVQ